MTRYEYKTVVLPLSVGFFRQGLPDITSALNTEARDGWRLKQVFSPITTFGNADSVVAIMERETS